MSSKSDIGVKSSAMDRRPTSPLLSESGLRSAAESYLHFRSHSRTGSHHSTSEATPTPSASAIRRAQQIAASDGNVSSSSTSKLSSLLHTLQPSSRLGSATHLIQPPLRSHSRADSGNTAAAGGSASPLPSHSRMPTPSGSTIRTPYNAANTLGPYGANPTLISGGSGVTLVSPGSSTMSGPPSAEKDNPWGALHVHVLPLFNRDPLRIPIEDLNALVRKQIVAVISRNPSKAVAQLEADVSELITAGMVTLNSKLAAGVDEEKLAARIVDLWGFFWDQVLPYVEGIFLPLQTDPYLQSLARTPKTNRPSSPSPNAISFDAAITSQSGTGGYSPGYSAFGGSSTSIGGSNISVGQSIDVRKLALRAFRDSVVLPVSTKLQKRFSTPSKDGNLNSDLSEHHKPRLEQMLLVLSSIATHNISLTSTTPTVTSQLATPGELAVTTLLRLVLYPPGTGQQPHQLGSSAFGQRLPSFLSSGAPRDRRGRLARRSIQVAQREVTNEELGGEGSMTTIGGGGGRTHVEGLLSIGMSQREREGRELLESLRSPNLDVDERPEEIGMGESGNGAEDGGEGAGNSVMMESLGTGPGGWGAGPPNTTQDLVASGQPPPPAKDMNPSRRAAIYEDVGRLIDEDSDTYDERSVISGVPMIVETQPLNLRRPSRIETDGDADTERREPERRPRI